MPYEYVLDFCSITKGLCLGALHFLAVGIPLVQAMYPFWENSFCLAQNVSNGTMILFHLLFDGWNDLDQSGNTLVGQVSHDAVHNLFWSPLIM